MIDYEYDEILYSAFNEERLNIFCGAGVSMLQPSNSPSWWEIYVVATTLLVERFKEGFEYAEDIDISELLSPFSPQQLADVLIKRFAGESFVKMLSVVDVADPNENHVYITALAAARKIRGVITTNFDTILERTAVFCNSEYAVVTPNKILSSNGTPLLKLHGSALYPEELKETFSQKASEVSLILQSSWKKIIPDSDLLVLGSSGVDVHIGGVSHFFEDFIKHGKTIWWLHQPGRKPMLPEHINNRVKLIEGALPDFIANLSLSLGVKGFGTSCNGLDAQQALKETMTKWSKDPTVGKWGAACVLLHLLDAHRHNSKFQNLYHFLKKIASKCAEELDPILNRSSQIVPASIFLNVAAYKMLFDGELSEAEKLIKVSFNVFESLYMVKDIEYESTFVNRAGNLSSCCILYSEVLMAQQKNDEASNMLKKALLHAYKAGQVENFLNAFYYIIEIDSKTKNIRRNIPLVEDGIRTADRFGIVQISIQLRILLANCHFLRNELWISDKIISDAKRRAMAIGNKALVNDCDHFIASLMFKRGHIDEGTAIIDKIYGKKGLTTKLVEELKESIEIGKIDQEAFLDNLDPMRKTAFIDEADEQMLLQLSEFESTGKRESAIQLCFERSAGLLERKFLWDVLWCTSNLLCMPGLSEYQKQLALGYAAHTHALERNYAYAEDCLEKCLLGFSSEEQIMPLETATTGMWLYIKVEKLDNACKWAKLLANTINKSNNPKELTWQILHQLYSHGEKLIMVSQTLEDCLDKKNHHFLKILEALAKQNPTYDEYFPFLVFKNAPDIEAADSEMDEVELAIQRRQPPQIIYELINSILFKYPQINDFQQGKIARLIIEAQALEINVQEIDKIMDGQRQSFLGNMQFPQLSIMESAILLEAIKSKNIEFGKLFSSRCDFITDFIKDQTIKERFHSLNEQVHTHTFFVINN